MYAKICHTTKRPNVFWANTKNLPPNKRDAQLPFSYLNKVRDWSRSNQRTNRTEHLRADTSQMPIPTTRGQGVIKSLSSGSLSLFGFQHHRDLLPT